MSFKFTANSLKYLFTPRWQHIFIAVDIFTHNFMSIINFSGLAKDEIF